MSSLERVLTSMKRHIDLVTQKHTAAQLRPKHRPHTSVTVFMGGWILGWKPDGGSGSDVSNYTLLLMGFTGDITQLCQGITGSGRTPFAPHRVRSGQTIRKKKPDIFIFHTILLVLQTYWVWLRLGKQDCFHLAVFKCLQPVKTGWR